MSKLSFGIVKGEDESNPLEKGEALWHGSWSNDEGKELAEVAVPIKGRRIGKRTYQWWLADVISRLHSVILEVGAKDLERGIDQAERLKRGRESEYGTPEEMDRRWAGYQAFIDELLMKRPSLSYDRACKSAAREFGVSTKTIKRRTRDPRQRAASGNG